MASTATASLEKVIQTAIDSDLKEVHTCLPAVVTRIDCATQLLDAQVTIQRKLAGELVNLPLLVNVPIRSMRSATFAVTFPIEVNDHVLILCSERSIDTWLLNGGVQDPFDVRKHSLSDAFAFPMMYPQTDLIPNFDPDNLQIKCNSGIGYFTLTPGGEIRLNGNTDSAIAFTDMKAAFDLLRTELNTFIAAYNIHIHSPAGLPPTISAIDAVADMSGAELPTIKVP